MRTIFILILMQLSINNYVLSQESASPLALTDENYDKSFVKKQLATVKGKIINATTEELSKIEISYSFVNLIGPFQSNYFTDVKPDGTFEFKQIHNLPYQQVWFSLGDYSYNCLYLNENLELTFDLKKLKEKSIWMIGAGVEFGGKDAQLNKTMNEYMLYERLNIPNFTKDLRKITTDDKHYLKKTDSLFAIKKLTNQSFFSKYGNSFQNFINGETEVEYISQKIIYYLDSKETINNINQILAPIYSISNNSSVYLQNLSNYSKNIHRKNNPENSKYTDFVNTTFPFNYADIINLQISDKDIINQKNISTTIILPALKHKWAKDVLKVEIERLNFLIKDLEEFKTSKLQETDSTTLGLFKNKTNFDATIYVNNDTTGIELLKKLRQKFPNKLILIDIWATWCGPCIQQMPYSKNLHHQATKENLPIEFVYLCTDLNSSEEKWLNKVLELKQPGNQLFVKNKTITEIFKISNRSGYPTYIAIKPNGEIDSKSIQRMSQITLEKLKELCN